MRILALLLACLIWLGITFFVPVVVQLSYRRREKNDHLEIIFSAWRGLWNFKMQIPALELEWDKGPQLEMENNTESPSGGKRAGKNRIRFRYFRSSFFYRLVPKAPRILGIIRRLKKQFYKGIHCHDLDCRLGIGSADPMKTALAAGSLWGVLHYSLARMYRDITMDTKHPRVYVESHFKEYPLQCALRGTFKLRLGHVLICIMEAIRAIRRLGRV